MDKIEQEKANPRDFEMKKGFQPKYTDYDEEAKRILFDYFLDKILDRDENKDRKCLDINLKIKTNLARTSRYAGGLLRNILGKVNVNRQLKITNLVRFGSLILQK